MQPKTHAPEYLKHFAEEGHGYPAIKSAELWLGSLVTFAQDAELTPALLADWKSSLRGYAPSSVNRAITVIRSFIRWGRVRGYHALDRDLVSDALRYVEVSTRVPVALTTEEIRTLCIAARAEIRVATFLALGLLTGMRPGEILRCAPAHHQPDRGLLCYATKTGRERVIPLADNPELAMLLSGAGHGPAPYCAGFSTFHWDTLCRAALGRTIPRKILRSTHSCYLASSKHCTEFEYQSRMGHSAEVANAHYRSMIQGVKGETVAQWLGAEAEIQLLVRRVCQ